MEFIIFEWAFVAVFVGCEEAFLFFAVVIGAVEVVSVYFLFGLAMRNTSMEITLDIILKIPNNQSFPIQPPTLINPHNNNIPSI